MALAVARWIDGTRDFSGIWKVDRDLDEIPPDRPFKLGHWTHRARSGRTPTDPRTWHYLTTLGDITDRGAAEAGVDAVDLADESPAPPRKRRRVAEAVSGPGTGRSGVPTEIGVPPGGRAGRDAPMEGIEGPDAGSTSSGADEESGLSVERRRAQMRELRDMLFPWLTHTPLGGETRAEARVRWDAYFTHAHEELARLSEEQRAPFAYEAGQIMAGRHQAPLPILPDSAVSSAEAEYAALYRDMMALVSYWGLLYPSPGIPLEQQPARVLSELLRVEFRTRATDGGVGGGPGRWLKKRLTGRRSESDPLAPGPSGSASLGPGPSSHGAPGQYRYPYGAQPQTPYGQGPYPQGPYPQGPYAQGTWPASQAPLGAPQQYGAGGTGPQFEARPELRDTLPRYWPADLAVQWRDGRNGGVHVVGSPGGGQVVVKFHPDITSMVYADEFIRSVSDVYVPAARVLARGSTDARALESVIARHDPNWRATHAQLVREYTHITLREYAEGTPLSELSVTERRTLAADAEALRHIGGLMMVTDAFLGRPDRLWVTPTGSSVINWDNLIYSARLRRVTAIDNDTAFMDDGYNAAAHAAELERNWPDDAIEFLANELTAHQGGPAAGLSPGQVAEVHDELEQGAREMRGRIGSRALRHGSAILRHFSNLLPGEQGPNPTLTRALAQYASVRWDRKGARRSLDGALSEVASAVASVTPYPPVDPDVRERWADQIHRARRSLDRLDPPSRSSLLAEAARLMAGRHQAPPPPVRPGAPQHEYSALHHEITLLVAAAIYDYRRGSGTMAQAQALSDQLRREFGTWATTAGATGARGPAYVWEQGTARGEEPGASATEADPFDAQRSGEAPLGASPLLGEPRSTPAPVTAAQPDSDVDMADPETQGAPDAPRLPPVADNDPESIAWFLRLAAGMPRGRDAVADQQHREEAEFGRDPVVGGQRRLDLWRRADATVYTRVRHPDSQGDDPAAQEFRARTRLIEQAREQLRVRVVTGIPQRLLDSPSVHLREAVRQRLRWSAQLRIVTARLTEDDAVSRPELPRRYGEALTSQAKKIRDELLRRGRAMSAERDPRVGWLLDGADTDADLRATADRMRTFEEGLRAVVHLARSGDLDLADLGTDELEQRRGDLSLAHQVFTALSERQALWNRANRDLRRELLAAELHTRQLQPYMERAALHRLRHLNRQWGTTYAVDDPEGSGPLLRAVHEHLSSAGMASVTHVAAGSVGQLTASPDVRLDELLGRLTDPGTPGAEPFRAVRAALLPSTWQSEAGVPHNGIAVVWKHGLHRDALYTPVAARGAEPGFGTGFTTTSLHALLARGDEEAVRLALAMATESAHDPHLRREYRARRLATGAHFGVVHPGRLGWQDVHQVAIPYWDEPSLLRAQEVAERIQDFAERAELDLSVVSVLTSAPLTPSATPEPVRTTSERSGTPFGIDYFPQTRSTSSALRDLDTGQLHLWSDPDTGITLRTDPDGVPWAAGEQPVFVRADQGSLPEHTAVQFDDGVTRDLPAREFAARVVADLGSVAGSAPLVLIVPYAGAGLLEMPRQLAARSGRRVWAFTRDLDLFPTEDGNTTQLAAVRHKKGRDGMWIVSEPDDLRHASLGDQAPDVVVMANGLMLPDTYVESTTLVNPATHRPIGRSSHLRSFQTQEQRSQATWPTTTTYGQVSEAGGNTTGERRALPWAEEGRSQDSLYYWDGHGRDDAFKLALDEGRAEAAPPAEVGRFLRRRPSLGSAAVVLVSCHAGAGTHARPAVAQTVANEIGNEVYAVDAKVSSLLNTWSRPDGRLGEWRRFSPRPTTVPDAPADEPDGDGGQGPDTSEGP